MANIGIKAGEANSHQSETNLIKTLKQSSPGAPFGGRGQAGSRSNEVVCGIVIKNR